MIGPIEVRRGIWLLKQANIKMLWENTELPRMVPKMGFAEANQAILKPRAQLMLFQRAKQGFKNAVELQAEEEKKKQAATCAAAVTGQDG